MSQQGGTSCTNCKFYRDTGPHRYDEGTKSVDGSPNDPTHITCQKAGHVKVRNECEQFQAESIAA